MIFYAIPMLLDIIYNCKENGIFVIGNAKEQYYSRKHGIEKIFSRSVFEKYLDFSWEIFIWQNPFTIPPQYYCQEVYEELKGFLYNTKIV